MNRRAALHAMLLLATTAIAGCTAALFADRRTSDTIVAFLIAEDRNTLVVLGEKYHYILDAPPGLVDVLRSPMRANVVPEFDVFYVANDGGVQGTCRLVLKREGRREDVAEATRLGFRRRWGGDPLRLSVSLTGQRFDAGGFDTSKVMDRFNQPYVVQVSEEQSTGEKAVKSVATPVTLTADGFLIYMYGHWNNPGTLLRW